MLNTYVQCPWLCELMVGWFTMVNDVFQATAQRVIVRRYIDYTKLRLCYMKNGFWSASLTIINPIDCRPMQYTINVVCVKQSTQIWSDSIVSKYNTSLLGAHYSVLASHQYVKFLSVCRSVSYVQHLDVIQYRDSWVFHGSKRRCIAAVTWSLFVIWQAFRILKLRMESHNYTGLKLLGYLKFVTKDCYRKNFFVYMNSFIDPGTPFSPSRISQLESSLLFDNKNHDDKLH